MIKYPLSLLGVAFLAEQVYRLLVYFYGWTPGNAGPIAGIFFIAVGLIGMGEVAGEKMTRLLLLTFIFCTGCAPQKPIKAWRFNTCQTNGGHVVCECTKHHTEVNPKADGGLVEVCE